MAMRRERAYFKVVKGEKMIREMKLGDIRLLILHYSLLKLSRMFQTRTNLGTFMAIFLKMILEI